MNRQFLLAPGPTPVPEEARLAMARSLIHHRGPEFKAIFAEVRQGLQWLFETEQPVLTLTCSGTGAFEAALANFTRRGETIICVGGGKFGERWAKVGRAYGLDVVDLPVEWGEALEPEALRQALDDHPDCRMVTLTASETSTGVYHPVEDIAAVVADYGEALFAVDGITAVGVHRLGMDEAGIDILVAGSQKAFGIPPGLGFVAASQAAWERADDSDHPRFYFDLRRERAKQADDQTAFTPAIAEVLAAREVLQLMREEGREALVARHEANAEATRSAVRALGLDLFASRPANSATAVVSPENIAAPDIVRTLRERHRVTIAGGQAELKPRVFRIGHIGFFHRSDILNAISSLELALATLGYDCEQGAGVAAAQKVFAAHASA